MSLKSLSQTRWRIEPNRVTIYPYGVFYTFAGIMAVLLSGLLVLYVKYQNTTVSESLPLLLVILLIVVLFWSFAATYIEFDNQNARMRKMFMGFLPTTTISFAKLQGINLVSNMGGSYNYRLFQKDSRYGKGIIVSSGYTKNDDPNAIAFVEDTVPVIHGYLDLHDTPGDYIAEPISSFRFFNQESSNYTVKNKKVGAIIFGLMFLVVGFYLLTLQTDGILVKVVIVAATLFLAAIFFNAAYTKIIFNTSAQAIQRSGPINYFNKSYPFTSFAGIQTVRRSMNFIYIGTDINMYFDLPDKNGKQDLLTVSTFRRSANIDRFIKEMHQIMGIV